jgi:DNA topoisomerase-1
MVEFARLLPKLRNQVERDLRKREVSRERVLACAVRLLDHGFFRIGSEGYAEENDTYGLATMRKRHVAIDGNTLVFDYEAKGGQRRVQTIADPKVSRLVKTLRERRGGGHELLAYRNGREWRDVRSTEINDYIKEVVGDRHSAKDFRTWNATVLAAVVLAASARERDLSTKGGRARAARRGQAGGSLSGQHAGRLPGVVHRPAGLRPLRRRPHGRRGVRAPPGGSRRVARDSEADSRRPCSTSSIGVNRLPLSG